MSYVNLQAGQNKQGMEQFKRSSMLPSLNAPSTQNAANDTQGMPSGIAPQKPGRFDKNDCKTCSTRKYQDGSADPGVSFKTPTRIAPKAAASAVKTHEMQHVFREKNKAQAQGRKIVSQSVTIHNAVCPECGSVYVSGGTTRTVSKTSMAKEVAKIVNNPDEQKRILDAIA